MQGLSVIICCCNSAQVLPETLAYIAKQITDPSIRWEVIVVDNASTDHTSAVAKDYWNTLHCSIPFTIIFEAEAGLSHARTAGLKAAAYEFVLFCDDDNLLEPNYIQLGYSKLLANKNIALLGGKGIAKLPIEKPDWFDRYAYQYAVGAQGQSSKDITFERGFVYGAGSFLRVSAYNELIQQGFQYTLTGRKGATLLSGEDNELGYSLSLLGYTIYYDEDLLFTHVLSQQRLSFSYLKKLKRGVAYSSVLLIPYVEKRKEQLEGKRTTFVWSKKLITEFLYLLNGYVKYPFASSDFKVDILLDRQSRLGHIEGLLANRKMLVRKEEWLVWLGDSGQ